MSRYGLQVRIHRGHERGQAGVTFVVLRARPHGATVVVGESSVQLKDPDATGRLCP
jgi:hypothetical protein